MEPAHDLDILEMPVEALAAYWLSIKKLVDSRKGTAIIAEELESATEPYIRHLLDTVFSTLNEPLVRTLARAKRETLLGEYHNKIDLMRLALFAIAAGENPRITLVRMDSKFAHAPLSEKTAFDMATGMLDAIRDKDCDLETLVQVDHKLPFDRLVVKLLFYAMYARREGRRSLERFLPLTRSRYFTDGLSLAMDNFEADFLAHHLSDIRDQTMVETGRKMDMSLEMALGIRNQLAYDDVYRIARSYMP